MRSGTPAISWCVLLLSLVACLDGMAQYPRRGPYPTGGGPPIGYPPGTYPPAPYPPGTYPPGTGQPGRLPPGAIPEGAPSTSLPVSEPKRARRPEQADKAKDPDALVVFQGVLLRRAKDSLLLEIPEHGFLRFHLSTGTAYAEKSGDTLQASQLQPGDTLSIEVRRGDVDTVVRAILVDKATPDARKLAENRPQPSTIHTPSSLNLLEDNSEAPTAAEASATSKDGRPIMRRGRPADYTPEGRLATWDGSDEGDLADVAASPPPAIVAAREALNNVAEPTPEYIVREFTTRDESAGHPPDWKRAEALAVDLVVRDGVEEFRNTRVNGKALDASPYEPGASPAAACIRIVNELLAPTTATAFDQPREETVSGRAAWVFRFRIPQSRSPWTLQAGGRTETLAYQGNVWIDRATHRVLRIEKQAAGIPSGFAFSEAKHTLEFSFIRLNQRLAPLPTHAENLLCGSAGCTRQITDFRNYRVVETVAGRE